MTTPAHTPLRPPSSEHAALRARDPWARALLSAAHEARAQALTTQESLRGHDPRLARPTLAAELSARLHHVEELCASLPAATRELSEDEALAAHETRTLALAEVEALRQIQHSLADLLEECGLLPQLHESYPQERTRVRARHT